MDIEALLKQYRGQTVWLLLGVILLGLGILANNLVGQKDEGMEIISETETESTEIVVDLQGAVAHPGVYRLSSGSRVNDVLIKTGGLSALADRDWVAKNINLAQKLVDGMKIYIPAKGEERSEQVGRISGTSIASRVNINTASSSELVELPGIGPVYAQKIIDHRPYQTIDDLLKVPGIGPKTLEKIKDQITL